jgi:hypothetical protein
MTETMAEGIREEEAPEFPPLLVKEVGGTKVERAEFGTWSTYVLLGTAADVPQRILPLDRNRRRAVIQVNPGIAGNATGFVMVGSKAQVANGMAAAIGNPGGQLVSGNSVTVENMQELYLMSDGAHSLSVVVLQERYAPSEQI